MTMTLLINGELVSGTAEMLDVINPSTEAVIATVQTASVDQAEQAVLSARAAFDRGPWPRLAPAERSAYLHRLADEIERRGDEFIDLAVQEVGTPILLARGMHLNTPLESLRYYADSAAITRRDTLPLRPDDAIPNFAEVNYIPVGVVTAITPYNYPLYLACIKVGAALAAGCTVVLTPSPLAPLTTLLLAEVAQEVLPAGVLNIIVGGIETGKVLTEHPAVDKVSFTGSVPVGVQIMRQAAGTAKGLVMELGGKSANIILPGTDLSVALPAVHGRYVRNAGQGCASPTRILVHRNQYADFVDASAEWFDRVPVGDPLQPETLVGPVITSAHRARVEGFVDDAVANGAKIVAGAQRYTQGSTGYFVAPSLIGAVKNSARVAQEEIFGPVGVLLPYDDIDDAVNITNDTVFGLSGNVYGPSIAGAIAVARRLRSGHITINGGAAMRPDGPFGGLKQSGFGREGGEWGIREFLEPQQVQWPAY
jgi:aldehyde dehydrogenase (NAD+)